MARELDPLRSGGVCTVGGVLAERIAGARMLECQRPRCEDRGGVEVDSDSVDERERLLTLEELAERLQYSVDWVRLQVRLGRIPAIRFNARAWRFHWPTVLKALDALG